MSKDSFFTRFKHTKTPHVFIAGETELGDFDQTILSDWRGEGFVVTYIAFGNGGADFVKRVQAAADKIVGVGEQYALIAFGNPGTPLISSLRHLTRIHTFVSHYPPQIPSPANTTFPPSISILLHLPANHPLLLSKKPEVLGIQSPKSRTTQKTTPSSGSGLGGLIDLGVKRSVVTPGPLRTYVYDSAKAGFAEGNDENFSSTARDLAWARSLAIVRRGAGMAEEDVDLESIRDAFFDEVASDPVSAVRKSAGIPATSAGGKAGGGGDGKTEESEVSRINLPTLTGGFDAQGLATFYREQFAPSAPLLRARLLSRTVGTTQVVDEMLISFKHEREVEWILPRVPPTGKQVRVVVVSVVGIKGGRCVSERMYWDQASVLVQIGMLDPGLVAQGFGGKGGKGKGLRMPVVGAEQAEAVEMGEDWDGVVNELVDGVKGTSIS